MAFKRSAVRSRLSPPKPQTKWSERGCLKMIWKNQLRRPLFLRQNWKQTGWIWLCQCHLIGTQAHTKTSMKTIPKFIQTFDQNCALISALHALSSARHPHCALISSRLSVQNTFFRAFHVLLTCLLRNRQITLLISHIRVIVRPIASAFSAIVWSQCLYKTGWQHGSCQPVHFIFSLFS